MRIDYETLKTQLNGEYRDIFTRAYHYCVWDWYSFSEISLDILTKT